MDTAALSEIRWLKSILKELGDDRESAKERVGELEGNKQEAERSAVDVIGSSSHTEEEDDNSEVDSLLHRAMLLLRAKANNSQHERVLLADRVSGIQSTMEPTDSKDEDDDELDELLQRALQLLRRRLTLTTPLDVTVGVFGAHDEGTMAQQEDGDEELDRLMRRAMLLFAERRRRALSTGEHDDKTDATLDVVRQKTMNVVTGSASPGSSATDDEENDEDDDELDRLLHRAMALQRRGLQIPEGSKQETEAEVVLEVGNEVPPMDWRKALRLQHLNRVQMKESHKRSGDQVEEIPPERTSKRARCLVELQEDTEVIAEAQPNESPSCLCADPEDPIAVEIADSPPAEIETPFYRTEVSTSRPEVAQDSHSVTPSPVSSGNSTTERPQVVTTSPQTSSELLALRSSNAKLVEENVALRLQLQAKTDNDGSDARMVLLLQEQVQRLQQGELELMRALRQQKVRQRMDHSTMEVAAAVAPPMAVNAAPAASARSPQKQRPAKKHKHKPRKDGGPQTPRKTKRRRNNLKQPLTKDMPRVLSELLKEPKVALLHRVVKHVGPKLTWQLLRETLRLEKEGGQQVNALASGKPELFFVVDEVSHEYKARRRTSGGVFFSRLKEKVSKEVYRSIYEVEDRKKKDAKKRARSRQRQKMDSTLAKLGFDDLTLAPEGQDATASAPASGDEAAAQVAPVESTTTATDVEDGEVAEDMQIS